MGNENLFAREFGMKPDPDLAAQWILSGKRRTLDLARVTEGERQLTPFVIMLSVGPDAGVIRRLSATRRGAINHLSYLAPIAQELFTPTLPRISIEVDGRSICDARRGMVVVANSRQYGARFDPAKNAKMDDGLLDVTFFPAENGAAWAWWMLMSLARVAGDLPGHVHAQGRQVRLVLPEGGSAQADGEHTWSGDGPIELSMAVEPGVLSVCAPTAS
jgi:diacylglycerol kinase family enzyme